MVCNLEQKNQLILSVRHDAQQHWLSKGIAKVDLWYHRYYISTFEILNSVQVIKNDNMYHNRDFWCNPKTISVMLKFNNSILLPKTTE